MRILVTGSTGFVGSHLLVELLQAQHEVVAVRRSGSEPVIPLEDQPIWLDRSLLELTANDLEGVEVVIHLASAGVSPKMAPWKELEQINVATGLQLIQLANQAGVRRFVAAGTCLEYGSEAEAWDRILPSASLRPTTPYAASKAASFLMLQAYSIAHPIQLFYGRIFTAYGEGQFGKCLWPSLRQAAMIGDDFSMTAGEQIADFIPVADVVRHLRIAAERCDLQPAQPLVVNIGSGQGMRLVDFARQQWKHFGATGCLKPGAIPPRPGQLARIVADPINLNPPTN
jgi:nucleoside-diphosphate-sugar epimerase